MIDIHSHILPGIDDGAQTLEDSITLCQYAVENGITHMLFTPHIHPGRYDNTDKAINEVFKPLKKKLEELQIPLKVSYAAEVRISVEMMEMVALKQIPFIGHYKGFFYLLLEMPHSHILPGSEKLIQWLNKRNIKVIIAHPERNKEIQRNIDKLEPFIKNGCLLQLTSASVSGKFGEICQNVSKQLIDRKWVSFVASDAHNIQNRPPDLYQAKPNLTQWVGAEKARKLLFDNQKTLTASHFA